MAVKGYKKELSYLVNMLKEEHINKVNLTNIKTSKYYFKNLIIL